MNKKYKKIKNVSHLDDATTSGEMVPSYFAWLTLEQQKRRAEELQNMTKTGNGDGDNFQKF